jgi:hypothetical protein
MNPAEDLFLYTPTPYFTAFVIVLYRHDLSRLRRPFRDGGTLRNWWLVLNTLGLLSPEQCSQMPSRRREFLPYLVFLSVSLGLSLSWALRLFPLLWYYLVFAQGIAGIILTAATMQYLGSPPRRPYVDVLRYPRLGSRLRHLSKLSLPKHRVNQQSEPESAKETPAANSESQEGLK